MRGLGDYLDLTVEQARAQWGRILRRQPRPRQEVFQPVEAVLCYALFFVVDPHKYGGASMHRAPPIVHDLAALFVRPPGSITRVRSLRRVATTSPTWPWAGPILTDGLRGSTSPAARRSFWAISLRTDVVRVLEDLNLADLWPHATEGEKRTLLDELLRQITIHPDRLTVHIHGAPPLNVALFEVGLKDSELSRVGGGT